MHNRKGEIFFDMTKTTHPLYGSSSFLLKRWTKHTIYARSGSYSRTDNPKDALYSTCSIYLYDYVVVSKEWFDSIVYSASIEDRTPAAPQYQYPPDLWSHTESTFRNSPNAVTNNYTYTYNTLSSSLESRDVYGPPPIFRDDGTYFEIVGGYPRNHFTHKRHLFSLYSLVTYGKENNQITSGSYKRNQQTNLSTVGEDGLEDGTSPVQATQVSNLNLIQSDNVINK